MSKLGIRVCKDLNEDGHCVDVVLYDDFNDEMSRLDLLDFDQTQDMELRESLDLVILELKQLIKKINKLKKLDEPFDSDEQDRINEV